MKTPCLSFVASEMQNLTTNIGDEGTDVNSPALFTKLLDFMKIFIIENNIIGHSFKGNQHTDA
jgi:hypothetical protein